MNKDLIFIIEMNIKRPSLDDDTISLEQFDFDLIFQVKITNIILSISVKVTIQFTMLVTFTSNPSLSSASFPPKKVQDLKKDKAKTNASLPFILITLLSHS